LRKLHFPLDTISALAWLLNEVLIGKWFEREWVGEWDLKFRFGSVRPMDVEHYSIYRQVRLFAGKITYNIRLGIVLLHMEGRGT